MGIKTALILSGACLLATVSAPVHAASSLIFCAEAAPEGFDPALWDSASTYNATRPVFQGLTEFKRGGVQVQPLLAESWTISPDGLEYVFTLRKGVKFQTTDYFKPSRDFNADDVVFTVSHWVSPELPFNQAIKVPRLGPESSGVQTLIKSVEKLGPYTVKIALKEKNAPFLSYFAMGFAGMQSAEYAAALLKDGKANQFNLQPIGTGPYQFKSYSKDAEIRYVANRAYWRGKQKTPSLVYAIVADPQVRIQKLKAGECHIAAAIRETDLDVLAKTPHISVVSTGALNISYLAYNLKRPPFANRDVRVALDMAIDRNSLFNALFPHGGAIQAVNPYPPTVPGWNAHNKNDYNPAKAKALLAKAGYPNGMDITLWALPVQRPTNPNGKLMAEMIQQDWAKIGVRAKIQSYEWGEYLKRAANGEHDVYMSGVTSTSGDPDDFLWSSLSCSVSKGGQRFCNKAFDALLEQGRQTSDPKARAAIYSKALAIFKSERPWITIAHSKIYIPMRDSVHGFIMNPNGSFDFENVWVSGK